MKNINFQTRFLILFIVLAFLEEVMTFQIGSVFFTPIKAFSIFAVGCYLNKKSNLSRKEAYNNGVRKGFTLLYSYILISIIFSILSGTTSLGGGLERFFHFFSSLIIIDLLILYLSLNKIDISKVIQLLLVIFYIELFVSFSEVVLQRPLIKLGIVDLSPLKIRGFHGDRIYLAEYLSLGWFLLYITNKSKLTLGFFGLVSFIVIVASGSNTAILLFLIVSVYIIYSIKSKVLKIFLLSLAIISSSLFNVIRNEFLSEADLNEIERRNEMYYEEEISESTNWRLFAIVQIWDEFLSNPTIFGNGYEASSNFLEKKSNFLYRMKPHNIISVLYDYGICGMLFAVILLFGLLKNILKMLVIKHRSNLSHLSFIFSALVLSRLLFYYHTTIVWVYIVGIAFIVIGSRFTQVKKYI